METTVGTQGSWQIAPSQAETWGDPGAGGARAGRRRKQGNPQTLAVPRAAARPKSAPNLRNLRFPFVDDQTSKPPNFQTSNKE